MANIIKANDVKMGMKLAESDGFLWDVEEIVKETPKTITIRMCSDFSSFEDHWKTKRNGLKGGLIKSFRKTTQIYVQ